MERVRSGAGGRADPAAARLEDAVRRILGLKAALGAAPGAPRRPRGGADGARRRPRALAEADGGDGARCRRWSRTCKALLPLDPARHRRRAGLLRRHRASAGAERGRSSLPELLRAREGFEVTLLRAGRSGSSRGTSTSSSISFGDETLLTRSRDLHRLAEARRQPAWRHGPAVARRPDADDLVRLSPTCSTTRRGCRPTSTPTATHDRVQRRCLECLMGGRPFAAMSPVDPFCALEDARC